MSAVTTEEMQQRLRAALRSAMKAKDTVAMSALRSALAAIANAEAVSPVPPAGRTAYPPVGSSHVAGSVAGAGAAEARRRVLTAGEVAAIIAAEVADRRAAAIGYEDSGNAGRATRLRREAEVIEAAQGS